MKAPTEAELVQAGLALADLGVAMATGRMPDVVTILRTLSTVAVDVLDVGDLKAALDAADQVRIDRLSEMVVEEKLGPRP